MKSNLSGTFIFGFDIGQLHKHRLDALSITSINKKKRPLSEIQTSSGQYKRFLSLGKESGKEIISLIKKNCMTNQANQPIVHLRKIEW